MGCQVNEDSNPELVYIESEYNNLANEVIEQDINISIYICEESYSLPITQLKVILDNQGETVVEYENPIYLDKFQDGEWGQIPYNDDLDFSMEAFELNPGETFEQEIAIENLNYKITEGEYRVRKSVQVGTKYITIADEFKIKD